MKVLIVDDDNDKIARVQSALVECGLKDEDMTAVYTIFDGKKALKDTHFDLMILDVLVPQRAGQSPDKAGALDLLTELSDRATLKKPRYILGLTAFDEALSDAGPVFRQRTWTVIKFSFDTDQWKHQIQSCVRYIDQVGRASDASYKTDVCVVTALLSPEHEAVLRLPWEWQPSEPLDDNCFVHRGMITSGERRFSVTAAHCTRMGMVSAALLTAKLIERERPRFVVMPGICAGVEGKTQIGDVIVAERTWDWQSGKHFVEEGTHGFAVGHEPIPIAGFVKARFDQLRGQPEVLSAIRRKWPGPPPAELSLRVGPMATGSAVVADADILDRIKTQGHRGLLAVEMEAFGVAAAADAASHPRPTAIICKSVCDFANESKDDKWQTYAAFCSAEVLRFFLERNLHEMSQFAGTR